MKWYWRSFMSNMVWRPYWLQTMENDGERSGQQPTLYSLIQRNARHSIVARSNKSAAGLGSGQARHHGIRHTLHKLDIKVRAGD